ncbi:MAG TPA: EI24 domain-containing protein [Polyangia bacterium]|nr:EI24 domain-containing protein [Polyangia bacterium]
MIARFFRGMGYFGRGWRVAFGDGRVVPFVLLPAAVTALVAGGGSYFAYRWAADFVARQSAGHGAIWGAVVWLFMVLFVVGTAYVLYVASCLLATAPFAGVLSERAEHAHTGAKVAPQSWGQTAALSARGLGQAILGVLLYLAIAVPLFVLHWVVPAVAPLMWVAGVVQTALFFAFDAFNEPLHRRGASFGGKWRFIGTHLAESLGFGSGVALLMVVPLLSVIVTPVAIVGGTLLYLDLAAGKSSSGSSSSSST